MNVDFAGCFEDEIGRKELHLFPVGFNDSVFGTSAEYRKGRAGAAGEKHKLKRGPSDRININSPKAKLIKYGIERIQIHIRENPGFLKQYPEFKDPKVIRRSALEGIGEHKRMLKEAAKKRARYAAAILKEIDSPSYCNQLKLADQKEVRANIRAVVLEYIMDVAVFIPTFFDIDDINIATNGIPAGRRPVDAIHVQEGYTLFGEKAGHMVAVKSANVPAIVNEALFWKSHKILGLLWTLAEQGDRGALLKLAKTLVPFVKALNEKLDAEPNALGLWPKRLPSWPVMKSPHIRFNGDHIMLLNNLGIGRDLPMPFDKVARLEKNVITKWVVQLYEQIEMRRGWMCDDDLPINFKKELCDLGELSKENWQVWWNIATKLLKLRYGDLAKIPELRDYEITPKKRKERISVTKDGDTSKHRKSDSQIRKFIFRDLKDKFQSFAGANTI